MQKLLFGLLFLVAGVCCDVITPNPCDSGSPAWGPGDAENVVVSVTDISGSPPYTFQTGKTYTVAFNFTAIRDVTSLQWDIFGHANTGLGVVDWILVYTNQIPLSSLQAGNFYSFSAQFQVNPVFVVGTLLNKATFYARIYDNSPGAQSDSRTVVCRQGLSTVHFGL